MKRHKIGKKNQMSYSPHIYTKNEFQIFRMFLQIWIPRSGIFVFSTFLVKKIWLLEKFVKIRNSFFVKKCGVHLTRLRVPLPSLDIEALFLQFLNTFFSFSLLCISSKSEYTEAVELLSFDSDLALFSFLALFGVWLLQGISYF